jgi:hypothetical protein
LKRSRARELNAIGEDEEEEEESEVEEEQEADENRGWQNSVISTVLLALVKR